jgi:drug/metabolite transporter (DMT)-like permease
VLSLSLLGISFAAPLVRLSANSGLVVAVGRLGISVALVAAITLLTGGWRQWRLLGRRDLLVAIGAGAMLALHFWTWNSSLALTTVAASVVLVNLQPAFVAGLSALWLRETPSRAQLAGIALAVAGAVVVGAVDAGQGGAGGARALLGDLLALVGALTVAVYYVAGRRLRQTLDLWPYVTLVYGACFVVLLAIALVRREPLVPQPPREWLIFAALALGPMMLGHTGMNWALKHLPAYVVNLTVLGEPVGATLLAAALPGIREVPGPHTLVGGALILAGAVVTAQGARARRG